jgi:hypothetical protein
LPTRVPPLIVGALLALGALDVDGAGATTFVGSLDETADPAAFDAVTVARSVAPTSTVVAV